MQRILCVWELGGGSGHLTNLRPFVAEARRRGHRVTVAAANEAQARACFSDPAIDIETAPRLRRRPPPPNSQVLCYSQLVLPLLGSAEELRQRCTAWQAIFDRVQPDLVIYEYAPTALIASLGRSWQKWAIGNGFLIPRSDTPYLGLFPRVRKTEDNMRALQAAESALLDLVNAMATNATGEIAKPRELFSQCTEQLLLTLPELDHLGARPAGDYVGLAADGDGLAPRWPASTGPRVFAYLSRPQLLPDLLKHLGAARASTLLYCPAATPALAAQHREVSFAPRHLDMALVLARADLLVSEGSHSTAARAFLAGVPQLVVAMGLEQYYLGRRLIEAGAAVGCLQAEFRDGEPVTRALKLARKRAQRPGAGDAADHFYHPLAGEVLQQRIGRLFDGL